MEQIWEFRIRRLGRHYFLYISTNQRVITKEFNELNEMNEFIEDLKLHLPLDTDVPNDGSEG